MNRDKFMKELALLLLDIDAEEREAALNYYEDYFDDAGEENEQQIIADLGSPKRVAAIIKDGMEEKNKDNYGEYTERGYQDERFRDQAYEVSAGKQDSSCGEQQKYRQEEKAYDNRKARTANFWKVLAIVLLCIFGSPVILGAAGTLLGVLASAFAILLAVAVVLVVFPVALIVSGIICILAGVVRIIPVPLIGILLCGFGAVLTGLGFVCFPIALLFFGKAIPALFNGIVNGIHRLFSRRGKEAY